jgi:hypothetical protein
VTSRIPALVASRSALARRGSILAFWCGDLIRDRTRGPCECSRDERRIANKAAAMRNGAVQAVAQRSFAQSGFQGDAGRDSRRRLVRTSIGRTGAHHASGRLLSRLAVVGPRCSDLEPMGYVDETECVKNLRALRFRRLVASVKILDTKS